MGTLERGTRKVEVWEGFWDKEDCEANPKKLFIFGDNSWRQGTGGQAIIRDADNSLGLTTKHKPSMDNLAFFLNKKEAFLIIQSDFQKIEKGVVNSLQFNALNVDTVVFSANGYGNGMAKLDEMYPEVYKWLHRKIANIVLTFGGQEEYEKLRFIDNDKVSILAGKEF